MVDNLASTVMFHLCTTGLMEGLRLLRASFYVLQSQLIGYKTIQYNIMSNEGISHITYYMCICNTVVEFIKFIQQD